MAACPTAVRIRDSKDKRRPHLVLSPGTWTGFLTCSGK
ncbi:DUF397 domain-containing protein [Streptomyces sp. NPDC093970]